MPKSSLQTFQGIPLSRGPKGAWTHLEIPFSVEQAFGTRARLPVIGTINGFGFRTSIMPRGDGTYYLAVTREMLAGAGISPGEPATFTLDRDAVPRTVEVPQDLLQALPAEQRTSFDALSYSHRKEFVDWITSAKRPETRTSRIAKTLEMLAAKQHLNR